MGSQDYVFTSSWPWDYWQFHGGPRPSKRLYTVPDWVSVIIFLLLCTLTVVWVQARFWHIAKCVFYARFVQTRNTRRRLGHIRSIVDRVVPYLPETDGAPLTIAEFRNRTLWSAVKTLWPHNGRDLRWGPQAVWLGVVAAVIFFVFIAFGVWLPLQLGHWRDDLTLVRSSQPPRKSLNEMSSNFLNTAQMADAFYRQCWLGQGQPLISPLCGQGPTLQGRLTTKARVDDSCPWGRDGNRPCHRGNTTVVVTQNQIFPGDLGIDTEEPIWIGHRLTCSAIDLERFITPNGDGSSILDFSITEDNNVTLQWSTKLTTVNGPNKYTSLYSGHNAYVLGRPWDLHIWPNYPRDRKYPRRVPEMSLHDSLEFASSPPRGRGGSDATVFILGYEAGQTWYSRVIDDPFFSAHGGNPNEDIYWADREMTAMICSEQFKAWSGRGGIEAISTGWMSEFQLWLDEHHAPLDGKQRNLLMQHRPLLRLVTLYTSVYRYLCNRQGVQSLIASMNKQNTQLKGIDTKYQFVKEAKAWMEISYVRGRYAILEILEQSGNGQDGDLAGSEGVDEREEEIDGEESQGDDDREEREGDDGEEEDTVLRNNVVFMDGNFVNIDVDGLWTWTLIQASILLFAWFLDREISDKSNWARQPEQLPMDSQYTDHVEEPADQGHDGQLR